MPHSISKKIFRKAGSMETMFLALMQEKETPNPFCLSQINGPVNPEHALTVIEGLQKHCPILCCHAEEIDGEFYFVEGSLPIQLEIYEYQEQWEALAVKEINHPFDQEKGPWVKAFLLYPGAKEEGGLVNFLTISHHVCSDGASLQEFHHQFIMGLQALDEGKAIDTKPFPFPDSEDQALTMDYQLPQVEGNPDIFSFYKEVPLDRRSTDIVLRELSQEDFMRLKFKCKKENTTIHGALCASQILSSAMILAKEKHQEVITVKCGTWFDYRLHVKTNPGRENMVFYSGPAAGGGAYLYPVQSTSNLHDAFWKLARRTRKDLLKDFENQSLLGQPEGEAIKKMVKEIHEGGLQHYYSDATEMISNLGGENYSKAYGRFTWEVCRFGFGMIRRCPPVITSGINGFNDKLFATFSYITPTLARETVELFADTVFELLKKC